MNQGRALSDEEKREAVEAIYNAWTSSPNMRLQRLGQLIDNAMKDSNISSLFYIEDRVLVEVIALFAARERM